MNTIITVVGALVVSMSGLTGVFYDDLDNLVSPQSIVIEDPTNGTLPALPPAPPLPEPGDIPRPQPPEPPQQDPCDSRECEEPCEQDCDEQPCDERHCRDHEPCETDRCEPPRECDEHDCHEHKRGDACNDCEPPRDHCHGDCAHEPVHDVPIRECPDNRNVHIYEKDTIIGAYHETWTFDVDCPRVKELLVSFTYTGAYDIGNYVSWNPELVLRDGDGNVMASSEMSGVRNGQQDQGLYFHIEDSNLGASLGEWTLDFSACTHVGDYELEIKLAY